MGKANGKTCTPIGTADFQFCCLFQVCPYSLQNELESTTEKKKIFSLWKLSLIFMQMICFNSISDTAILKPVCPYVLLKLAMLCGWRCCQSCFCWTASCWDWSEVERRLTSGDTQFAGMIKPTIRCPSSVLSRTICIFTFVPLTDARTPSTFVQTLSTEPHNT